MSDFVITANVATNALKAIEDSLKATVYFVDFNVRIERGEELNEDPDKMPWVGIYPMGEQLPIRTMGMGNGFRAQQLKIAVICQASGLSGASAVQDDLGVLVAAVESRILTDTSLGGSMDVITDFDVFYAEPGRKGDRSIQSAVIQFTAEKLVKVSTGG